MEMTVGRVLSVLLAAVAATGTGLTVGYIAHFDLGLSREEIRSPAVAAAAVIATLLVIEFFRKKLRKPK
jgi:hypothetical protein